MKYIVAYIFMSVFACAMLVAAANATYKAMYGALDMADPCMFVIFSCAFVTLVCATKTSQECEQNIEAKLKDIGDEEEQNDHPCK